MSFQAYLDTVEDKTGLTPRQPVRGAATPYVAFADDDSW